MVLNVSNNNVSKKSRNPQNIRITSPYSLIHISHHQLLITALHRLSVEPHHITVELVGLRQHQSLAILSELYFPGVQLLRGGAAQTREPVERVIQTGAAAGRLKPLRVRQPVEARSGG